MNHHEQPIRLNPDSETLTSESESISEFSIQEIERIKQALFDPRAISEKYDLKGRKDTTVELLEARAKTKDVRGSVTEKEATLKQIKEETEVLNSARGEKVIALEQRLETIMARFKKLVGIKDKAAVDLQENIGSIETEIDGLFSQAKEVKKELEDLRQRQLEIPSPQRLLEAYYEKMETVPLTNEEKREMLKPEILASLSTEEYIALWRRLNPYFLAHITRQGFRDHADSQYHQAGLFEWRNGLVDILEDKKTLRPPIAVRGLRSRDEATVKEFLKGQGVLQVEDEKEARYRLNKLINVSLGSAPKYPDKTAIHFATQIVPNRNYGTEGGNEAFFVYPSDILASQHNFTFNGDEADFTRPQSDYNWNDIFIWPSSIDKPGIPVDAGMVFLPENMPVDPNTGTKYAFEVKVVDGKEKRVMVEDTNLSAAFIKLTKSLNDESPLMIAYTEWKQSYAEWEQEKRDLWKRDKERDKEDKQETILRALEKDLQGIGFCKEAAVNLSQEVGWRLIRSRSLHSENDLTFEEAMQKLLRNSGENWKRAENTISAKEYWEGYFAKNPQSKPKHLIYYDGSPTTAIYEFQQRNNIGRADVSKTEGRLLGFDDHYVHKNNMETDPRSSAGYDELIEKAHRIIAEHYGSNNKAN